MLLLELRTWSSSVECRRTVYQSVRHETMRERESQVVLTDLLFARLAPLTGQCHTGSPLSMWCFAGRCEGDLPVLKGITGAGWSCHDAGRRGRGQVGLCTWV